jgi:transposase
MYGIEMKYTVKTLLERGYSQRAIALELSINRKTIAKYIKEFNIGDIKTPKIHKNKKLDPYIDDIKEWLSQGLTGVIIRDKMFTEKGVTVGYATVSRFINQFKTLEVYIPLIAKPAEEAQVDFGYLGRFLKDDKWVKVWCFSIVLSHSRYSYHKLVTNQSVSTFINCHIESFEYFGGVPYTVKIDNLKAGVIAPDFYEPSIQRQYADFLRYYKSVPITARIRRGQDKGKVEASVKYVKSNFLKRVNHKDFYQLEKDILEWTNNTCNIRLHGTTKKIPLEVFNSIEKINLQTLPCKRYEILKIEHRKVNNYGHISFKNNFYSVPYKYIGKTLIVKSTDTIIRIFEDTKELAIHQLCNEDGKFISVEEHKPPEKQRKTEEEYIKKAMSFGVNTYKFLQQVKNEKPYQWHRIMSGIFHLQYAYSKEIVDKACNRALQHKAISFLSVKNICKNNLYDKAPETLSVNISNGFAHSLKKYDSLTN